MAYDVKILADSRSLLGARLTTFEVTFPRFILAEVNTHRVLSRNSASSRAIPVHKSIAAVREDPFIPEQFGKNRPGMSADEALGEDQSLLARAAWEDAMHEALKQAERLSELEVHKGLANRILEPYKWHTAIISGTQWRNFFALRTAENAQPEFRKVAMWMQALYEEQEPAPLANDAWHLPLVSEEERMEDYPVLPLKTALAHPFDPWWDKWKKVSVGRCARVSYLTHDGKRDPVKDIELHDNLLKSGHMSPFEHIATPHHNYAFQRCGNFQGWVQYRKKIRHEDDFSKVVA